MPKHIAILLFLFCINTPPALAEENVGKSFFENAKEKVSDFSEYARDKYRDIKEELSVIATHEREKKDGNEKEDRIFKTVWKNFSNVSSKAAELATDKNPTAKTAFEFVTFQEPKYIRLIREAQEILSDTESSRQFECLEKLRHSNAELRSRITELKRERITAPEKSLNPVTRTRKNIDEKLQELSDEIRGNDEEIAKLKQEILEIINRHGINLSLSELDYFIVSAEGNDLMNLIAIAENMKTIQKIIENELNNDKNNMELARVYTGMYLVSLDAYDMAHDSAMENLSKYRSKLADIRQEAISNRDEAKSLRRSVASDDKTNVESNIKINDRMIEVAQMYDQLLDRRSRNLRESKANLDKKLKVARNTYRTIVNGASLVNLVNEGSNEYMLIVNFEMPELKNMYDETFMSVFSDIAEKIKMEE